MDTVSKERFSSLEHKLIIFTSNCQCFKMHIAKLLYLPVFMRIGGETNLVYELASDNYRSVFDTVDTNTLLFY